MEAGLRTGNIYSPWPEEANRKLTGAITTYHFAPTETSQQNLLNEAVAQENITVTGNTVIDALLDVSAKLKNDTALNSEMAERFSFLNKDKKLILVTGHRRRALVVVSSAFVKHLPIQQSNTRIAKLFTQCI